MDDSCLEFSKYYRERLKDKFHDEADKYFDGLVLESEINVEENGKTVSEYDKKCKEIDNADRNKSKLKSLKGLCVFFFILGFISAFVGIVLVITNGYYAVGIPVAIVGLALGIILFVLMKKSLDPKLENIESVINKLRLQAKEILNKAWKEVYQLNRLFDRSMTKELVEKCLPILKLDENFNLRRLEYLQKKYKLDERTPSNMSTIGILSGEIQGNPFVMRRLLDMKMLPKVYTGSITIHWTETHYDSDGNPYTSYETEVLTASVTKPAPNYSTYSEFIYGNDAAPNLKFTHNATHVEDMSAKEQERFIKKGEKKIQKISRENIENGGNFTEMGNSEFDVLFNAIDRNNEVEFRLLFTPLAQKNMLDLMKNTKYGDDFNFLKRCQLNYITSENICNWDIDVNTNKYRTYDVKKIKENFVTYNCDFFEHLCFALAPVMSIPLYQQQKPVEFIYKDRYATNYTISEYEYMINKLDKTKLAHESTNTNVILKADFIKKNKTVDVVSVTANSFATEERVDYISRWGGDGNIHEVPVYWIEYIPLTKTTEVGITTLDLKDREFYDKGIKRQVGNCAFAHGLLAYEVNDSMKNFDGNINLFNKEK